MTAAAQKLPQIVREDLYDEAFEAFIRTSAGYLDVDRRMPEQGVTRQRHERATPVDTLR